MKKKIYLLAGTLFVLSLCSCSIQIFTDGKHQAIIFCNYEQFFQ